ncbi:MAG TPA: hypothetical protein VK539_39995 [Myxococcaceae bacterium]|nr:hypothetical protein [Myxococcaceae bacterium]
MRSRYPDKVILENKSMEGERLELCAKNVRYYLGSNLTLRRCTLVLGMSSDLLHLAGARLMDCTIELKRQLKEVRWYAAYLKGCRFTGHLFSCDFGHFPGYSTLPCYSMGGIEDCDFTDAHLHACQFVGCDASTLKLPLWPYFTLLEPYRRHREFASILWPREIRSWLTGLDEIPKTTSAITYSATAFAKKAGVSEDRIRALIEGRADILY